MAIADLPQEAPVLVAVNQTQLYERAYELIREAILRGQLKPGQRLRADHLARELAISQTPVRAALTRLEGDGLVRIVARVGTFVSEFTAGDVQEVFQLRRILECAGLDALASLSEDTLARLTETVRESAALVDGERFTDYHRYIQLDAEFHCLIVALMGNERATAIYEGLRWPLQLTLGLYRSERHRALSTVTEHANILAALKARDASLARELLLAHLAKSEADLLQRMPSHSEGQP
jgi:DNA-binding GntR family transcriptional regulator